MIKVKMLKTSAGPKGVFNEGKTYIIESELGESLVDAGAAVKVRLADPKIVESTQEPVEPKIVESTKEPKASRGRKLDPRKKKEAE